MPGYDAPKITEKSVDSTELADLIRVVMAERKTICFDAPGKSMEPFIHSKDTIFVSPVEKIRIQIGDVIVFVHPRNGRVLAHRAVRISEGRFYSMGDNSASLEDGWISFTYVLGRVVSIRRDGKGHRLGLGPEKLLIALLSREGILVPSLNCLRRIKSGFQKLFPPRE